MDVSHNLVDSVQILSLTDSELLCASEPMIALIEGMEAPAFSYTWENSELTEVKYAVCYNRHAFNARYLMTCVYRNRMR